jgi:hypothetical protein
MRAVLMAVGEEQRASVLPTAVRKARMVGMMAVGAVVPMAMREG